MSLDYPITRSFSWRWFTPISLAGSFIVIVFLSVINTALTGYETVTRFTSDFNSSQTFWFDRLLPFYEPKPRTLCDGHVFNVGDPLTTNYSYFQWIIDSILVPNAGQSGMLYIGLPLTFCDVITIYVDGSLLSWSIDFTVITYCADSNLFNVTARATFSMGLLPGRYSSLLGLRSWKNGSEDMRGLVLNSLLSAATQDLGGRAYNALLFSNKTSVISLSAEVSFNYCPMSFGLNASCATNPPRFKIIAAASVFPNSTIHYYNSLGPVDPVWNPWVLDNDTELAVYNLLQTIHAAVRIDLGNPSLNNFILYPAAMNNTISPTFPITPANGEAFSNSSLYTSLSSPFPELQQHLPLTLSGPATIQVVYPCQFQQLKPPGALFISVLVATLSMFSTGWAIYMSLAANAAKRHNPTANRCYEHSSFPQHRLDLDSSFLDEAFALQASGPKRQVSRADARILYQPVAQSPRSLHLRDLPTSDAEIVSINGTTSESHEATNVPPDS